LTKKKVRKEDSHRTENCTNTKEKRREEEGRKKEESADKGRRNAQRVEGRQGEEEGGHSD